MQDDLRASTQRREGDIQYSTVHGRRNGGSISLPVSPALPGHGAGDRWEPFRGPDNAEPQRFGSKRRSENSVELVQAAAYCREEVIPPAVDPTSCWRRIAAGSVANSHRRPERSLIDLHHQGADHPAET